jgi:hypothetical protein
MGRLVGFVKSTRGTICCFGWLCAAVSTPALAQSTITNTFQNVAADPPAHVSFVDGTAALERDGQRDSAPANMPLLSGDRLRTENGRLEVLFGDNSTLHMDTYTTVDFQSDELVRLLDGRVRLAIPGQDRQVSYRVDTPSASAIIGGPGEYRISILREARGEQIELAVLRGRAELVNDGGRTALRAGERAYANADAAPSYAYAFNSASWDAFDRWSESRRDQRFGVSTQYLPSEVQPYATAFDQYGSWQYSSSYGYVWYPSVAVGWRPYYAGRWVTVRPYGWTWVGVGPWAWPTHHYGRWGYSSGAWFWIPGHTWAPAWVSWAYAPGYVSWCPLGWNNHGVFTFGFTFGYDPWRAWTVVPYGNFGHGYVHVNYVGGHAFDATTRTAFVSRTTAPAWRGYAVPRSASPIHVAGTVQPRTPASTVYTNLDPNASRVGQGGRRVTVGPSRSSARDAAPANARTDATPRAVPRGVPADQSNAATSRANVDRSLAGAGVQDRSADASRQAIPRADASDRSSASPPSTDASRFNHGQAGTSRIVDVPTYRDNPYARRPYDGANAPRAAVPREYQPNGMVLPDARGRAMDSPVYVVPRTTPPSGMASPAVPDNRPYTYGDRRAPTADHPSAPAPQTGTPVPRANPGAAPDSHGGGASSGQGHSRGGQPSAGAATPRGRG